MTDSSCKISLRRNEIAELAANKALELPLLPSGFWFHHDFRDNFYYASHLFSYCVDKELECKWSTDKREEGKRKAEEILSLYLGLQVKDPNHSMYGHWPLNWRNYPEEPRPHKLPFEIMGCMLILLHHKYSEELSSPLKLDLEAAILHLYKSGIYRLPLNQIHHHEAKHTSLIILLGHYFQNHELLEEGGQRAAKQLKHIRQFGFKEYGILPWFWHWVQSFTSVWEVVETKEIREVVSEMLEHLWNLRSDYYLKGTWVGPQSRSARADSPKDQYTLFDYIQFGDFPKPKDIIKLEGNALFTYKVSDEIVKKVTERSFPVERKGKIQFSNVDGNVTSEGHTYVYIESEYAVGGIWERIQEFDNEQQRWDITFPLTEGNETSINQAFFLHPGEKYTPGDERHASPYGEVLFYRNTAVQMWHIPLQEEAFFPNIVGCLPLGEWQFERHIGYGKVEDTYLTFQLLNDFTQEEKKDRITVTSSIDSRWNGVIMEVISLSEAENMGIKDLYSFIATAKEKNESSINLVHEASDIESINMSYTTLRNDVLSFSLDKAGSMERTINGEKLSFMDYTI